METGFFWLWWNEQNEEKRDQVRQLISEGRLEIAGGGWSMADEATPHPSGFGGYLGGGPNTTKDTVGQ